MSERWQLRDQATAYSSGHRLLVSWLHGLKADGAPSAYLEMDLSVWLLSPALPAPPHSMHRASQSPLTTALGDGVTSHFTDANTKAHKQQQARPPAWSRQEGGSPSCRGADCEAVQIEIKGPVSGGRPLGLGPGSAASSCVTLCLVNPHWFHRLIAARNRIRLTGLL